MKRSAHSGGAVCGHHLQQPLLEVECSLCQLLMQKLPARRLGLGLLAASGVESQVFQRVSSSEQQLLRHDVLLRHALVLSAHLGQLLLLTVRVAAVPVRPQAAPNAGKE
jgi:hypothetical protein